MNSGEHATWMDRAIRLAMDGRGSVEPNPMVGCILVRDGKIIGQGKHERFGERHAEPNALGSCTESPEGATAYVTLEPCCHTNKKTPPCVPALIGAKISRVVIGCLDPNPEVSGQGVKQLREAGIEVVEGVLEAQAKQLNAAYFAGVLHHRPYVTLKWAESSDGKVAGPFGHPVKISNDASLAVVHDLRARCDAILVGIRTAMRDNPLLTARPLVEPRVHRTLMRVVLDPELRLSPDTKLAHSVDQGQVVIYCSQRAYHTRGHAVGGFIARKIETVPLPAVGNHLKLPDMLRDLHIRGATHLLVEPGPGLARPFIEENLADRIWRFCSPNAISSDAAPVAIKIDYPIVAQADLSGDRLIEYYNPSSDAFFASVPSAEMTLLMGN